MSFTKGPWKATESNAIFDAAGEQVAGCGAQIGQSNPCANARLIAAAPELLEGCKYALKCFEQMERDYCLGEYQRGISVTLEAAIAKAEGQ